MAEAEVDTGWDHELRKQQAANSKLMDEVNALKIEAKELSGAARASLGGGPWHGPAGMLPPTGPIRGMVGGMGGLGNGLGAGMPGAMGGAPPVGGGGMGIPPKCTFGGYPGGYPPKGPNAKALDDYLARAEHQMRLKEQRPPLAQHEPVVPAVDPPPSADANGSMVLPSAPPPSAPPCVSAAPDRPALSALPANPASPALSDLVANHNAQRFQHLDRYEALLAECAATLPQPPPQAASEKPEPTEEEVAQAKADEPGAALRQADKLSCKLAQHASRMRLKASPSPTPP